MGCVSRQQLQIQNCFERFCAVAHPQKGVTQEVPGSFSRGRSLDFRRIPGRYECEDNEQKAHVGDIPQKWTRSFISASAGQSPTVALTVFALRSDPPDPPHCHTQRHAQSRRSGRPPPQTSLSLTSAQKQRCCLLSTHPLLRHVIQL